MSGAAVRSAGAAPAPTVANVASASQPTTPLLRPSWRYDTPHSCTDGSRRWPVIESIPYLRAGREALAARALAALDDGDATEALALLLADRDEWDRTTVPSHARLRALANDAAELTFRAAMDALAYGGVATYFAHRFGDPTFVAGLGLLAAHRPRDGSRSFELACGAGHYLRELARAGVAVAGGDVVFSKLWLARRYLAPHAALVCFDASAPWPIASAAYDLAHVHDALYFLPEKTHVARELRRVLRAGGTLAISHAHNAAVENLSAGAPLDRAGYAALFPEAVAYDDRALARAVVEAAVPLVAADDALDGAPAFAFVTGPTACVPRACADDVALPPRGATLTRNPLYAAPARAALDAAPAEDALPAVVWPSARYECEYAALATYPARTRAPERATMDDADPTIVRFARTRELIALPERW
ncbi:MAG: hypothetical protein NVSMB21_07730 [Vulcanimicrobiaceae bacterium]